jgi:hypothetical protein
VQVVQELQHILLGLVQLHQVLEDTTQQVVAEVVHLHLEQVVQAAVELAQQVLAQLEVMALLIQVVVVVEQVKVLMEAALVVTVVQV